MSNQRVRVSRPDFVSYASVCLIFPNPVNHTTDVDPPGPCGRDTSQDTERQKVKRGLSEEREMWIKETFWKRRARENGAGKVVKNGERIGEGEEGDGEMHPGCVRRFPRSEVSDVDAAKLENLLC